ncbi:RNA polymerase sigma factor [Bacillus sp. JJ722]|uniref:RNA polymerase sigma factor n=1 Tax=Bacillus sp. JJ722 TaxID=3122973 RepID=UPI002FFD95CC
MIDFESRWIRKVQHSSHEESASKLIQRYYKEIFVFVYKQMLEEQLALDLTQEIFIRMLQSINSYDVKKASFRTWIYRIASNHCTDYFRSRTYHVGQQTMYVDELEIEGVDDVVEKLEKKEDYEHVNHLIFRYEIDAQQILRYKLFLELTFQEIAKLLNLSESTVKTKYYSALKKLKKEMEGYVNG